MEDFKNLCGRFEINEIVKIILIKGGGGGKSLHTLTSGRGASNPFSRDILHVDILY